MKVWSHTSTSTYFFMKCKCKYLFFTFIHHFGKPFLAIFHLLTRDRSTVRPSVRILVRLFWPSLWQRRKTSQWNLSVFTPFKFVRHFLFFALKRIMENICAEKWALKSDNCAFSVQLNLQHMLYFQEQLAMCSCLMSFILTNSEFRALHLIVSAN